MSSDGIIIFRALERDYPPVGVSVGGISVGVGGMGVRVGGMGVRVGGTGVGGAFNMIPGTNQKAFAFSGVPPFT